MEIRKIIQRGVERREGGLDLQVYVSAVVAAHVGEDGQRTYVSSQQSVSSCGGSPRREEAYPKEEPQCARWTPPQIRKPASLTG